MKYTEYRFTLEDWNVRIFLSLFSDFLVKGGRFKFMGQVSTTEYVVVMRIASPEFELILNKLRIKFTLEMVSKTKAVSHV